MEVGDADGSSPFKWQMGDEAGMKETTPKPCIAPTSPAAMRVPSGWETSLIL